MASKGPKAGVDASAVLALVNRSIPSRGNAGSGTDCRQQQAKIIRGLIDAGVKKYQATSIVEAALTAQARASGSSGPMMFLQGRHVVAACEAQGVLPRDGAPSKQLSELIPACTWQADAVEVPEPDDVFLVSLYFEKWDEAALEAGETDDRGEVFVRETVDADDLKRYGREYELSQPSATDPNTPRLYFCSEVPDENREHFEAGIDTYYSLHVHAVNGREPGPEDYQKVADLVGAKFSRPMTPAVTESASPESDAGPAPGM